MKFKYIGQLPVKDGDLVLAKIFKPTDIIKKGTVFEVPEDDALLIQRIQCNGNFAEYVEPKKVGRPKKDKKEEKEEEED